MQSLHLTTSFLFAQRCLIAVWQTCQLSWSELLKPVIGPNLLWPLHLQFWTGTQNRSCIFWAACKQSVNVHRFLSLIMLTFSSSGALYNYGVLKRIVTILGGKGAFPLKFDGWTAGQEGQRVVEISTFCKSVEEKLFLQTLKCTILYKKTEEVLYLLNS